MTTGYLIWEEQLSNEFSNNSASLESEKIAVVIPSYNGEKSLVRSLHALSQQSFGSENFQVYVADNNSTDNTAKVAQEFGATVVPAPDFQTSYHARNCGLLASDATILLFTDDDCIPDRDWVEKMVQPFAWARIGVVVGEIVPDSPTTWAQKYCASTGDVTTRIPLRSHLPFGQTANLAVRREVFQKIGLFREGLRSGGDLDICWRAQRETDFLLCFQPTAIVHHEHQRSFQQLFKKISRYGYGMRSVQNMYKEAGVSFGRSAWREELAMLLKLILGGPFASLRAIRRGWGIAGLAKPIWDYRRGRAYHQGWRSGIGQSEELHRIPPYPESHT